MDFMDTDLHKVISSNQFFEIEHVRVILYQILCGLLYMQSAGVIHRDIKPANILLNEVAPPAPPHVQDVSVKICDFGLARELSPLRQRRRNAAGGKGGLQQLPAGAAEPVAAQLGVAAVRPPSTTRSPATWSRGTTGRPSCCSWAPTTRASTCGPSAASPRSCCRCSRRTSPTTTPRHPLFPGKYSSFSPRSDSPVACIPEADGVMLKEDDQICVVSQVMGRPPRSFLDRVPFAQVREQLEEYPERVGAARVAEA